MSSLARWAWFWPATFFMVAYCVGVPLFFFSILYKNKHLLCPCPCPEGYTCNDQALIAKYGLLFQAYKPRYWWFELLQMYGGMHVSH
jgi:hypothetical protein